MIVKRDSIYLRAILASGLDILRSEAPASVAEALTRIRRPGERHKDGR